MNVNNNNREEDISDEDKNDESETATRFDAILKDIKNIGRTTKPISVKSHGSNINLHPLIIKLINAGKKVLKKDYGFDEACEIFDEIDKNFDKRNEHNPRSSNMIIRKNEMLQYLKLMEWKLVDMFSTPTFVRKINNDNYKDYVHDKLLKVMSSGDIHHAEAILDSFVFKRLKKH